ncbi:putative phosphoribosylformylglycinamidine synthase [Dictyocaulus viviparus]|uniref:Putative phosphoribosylformylglycinamidine synthase n=1 Tax=Dictyocaulus viviparus TaxID=29172 RepID=A0A0D8XVT2_DICVI|nr:putative phosphoribosylformylglycinamidine synthase [Dictyocaulus viviparus]
MSIVGGAVAVGEQPIKGLLSPGAGARMTVAEALTNLLPAPISDIKVTPKIIPVETPSRAFVHVGVLTQLPNLLNQPIHILLLVGLEVLHSKIILEDVKMSGNWMWAAKCDGEGARLVETCDALCQALAVVGCAIDGGKDSLGMATTVDGELVKAPGTLVLSAYASCPDVTKVLTPDFKGPRGNTTCTNIVYIRMGSSLRYNRLGGSALAQVLRQIGDDPADIEDLSNLAETFTAVQQMIVDDLILSVHDVSDGGFITALLEMSFAGNISFKADITSNIVDPIVFLFSEESGVFLEVEQQHAAYVIENLRKLTEVVLIGEVYPKYGPDAMIEIIFNREHVINERLVTLREVWEETSDRLGMMQTDAACLQEAKQVRATAKTVSYSASFHWQDVITPRIEKCLTSAPRVAIIREEGSNGDREMAAAFTIAGFQAYDVTMTDLLSGHTLDQYRYYHGWAAAIQYNPVVRLEFARFRSRSDTLSFGVCNGCQLMAYLGWVGEYGIKGRIPAFGSIPMPFRPWNTTSCKMSLEPHLEGLPSVFLAENRCGRFESFFGPVRIVHSTSIWLKDMTGSVLGLWSSHGEGRFLYRSPEVLDSLQNSGQISMQYVDGDGCPTMKYPWNPNGSDNSVAAICSLDGRNLAMMPHSDRSFLSWQWAEYPNEWNITNCASPWLKMFQNAYYWVTNN